MLLTVLCTLVCTSCEDFDAPVAYKPIVTTEAHGQVGSFQAWNCFGQAIRFKQEWQTFHIVLTVTKEMAGDKGLGSIAFSLAQEQDKEVTFYFDNVSVWSD